MNGAEKSKNEAQRKESVMEVKETRPQEAKPQTSADTKVCIRRELSVDHLWFSFWEGEQLIRVPSLDTHGNNPPEEGFHKSNKTFPL